MSIDEILSTGMRAVAALGGVAIVAGGVAKFVTSHASSKWLQEHQGQLNLSLETHKSELSKATENHKLSLKRLELIFQREIEAADAYLKLWRLIYPQYRFPYMEWEDACADVAGSLGTVETALEDFLEQHSVAISKEITAILESARFEASTHKFHQGDIVDGPPDVAIEAAGRILDGLKMAKEQIIENLRR